MSNADQALTPLQARLTELLDFYRNGAITWEQTAQQLVAEGYALTAQQAMLALCSNPRTVKANNKGLFDEPAIGYHHQVLRNLALAPNPGAPLMTRIYNLHNAEALGLITRQESIQNLAQTGQLTELGAKDVMARDPKEVDAQYPETLDAAREDLARLSAEKFVNEWNAGKGFDDMGL